MSNDADGVGAAVALRVLVVCISCCVALVVVVGVTVLLRGLADSAAFNLDQLVGSQLVGGLPYSVRAVFNYRCQFHFVASRVASLSMFLVAIPADVIQAAFTMIMPFADHAFDAPTFDAFFDDAILLGHAAFLTRRATWW